MNCRAAGDPQDGLARQTGTILLISVHARLQSGAPNLCRSHAIPGPKFGPLDRSNELAAHWCLGLYLNEADLGRRALSKCAQGSSSNKSDDGEPNSKFDLRASVVHCHLRGIAA